MKTGNKYKTKYSDRIYIAFTLHDKKYILDLSDGLVISESDKSQFIEVNPEKLIKLNYLSDCNNGEAFLDLMGELYLVIASITNRPYMYEVYNLTKKYKNHIASDMGGYKVNLNIVAEYM